MELQKRTKQHLLHASLNARDLQVGSKYRSCGRDEQRMAGFNIVCGSAEQRSCQAPAAKSYQTYMNDLVKVKEGTWRRFQA